MIITPPRALAELAEWAFSDALDIDYEMLDQQTFVVWMLKPGYSYERWIASLSLDDRWTLSPAW